MAGHTLDPSAVRPEMTTESIFPFFFTGIEELDDEHGRIVALLDRLSADIGREDFDRALESAELVHVDLDAHFAFEELVMARTEFPAARRHCGHHAAQLSALLDFLGDLRGVAAAPGRDEDRDRLLGKVTGIKRDLEAHIDGPDLALRRHVVNAAR
jgi:hemerythrin